MSKRLASRVLFIGWDAADWQMIQPLLEKGWMPNLQKLIDRGVMGRVSTLFPILSPILWTSIATGKRADRHGILGFCEPDGKTSIRPVSSTSRKCKAVWNILSQNGLKSGTVGWFASHPAEQVDGYVVTDRYRNITVSKENPEEATAMDDKSVHPPRLREVLESLRVAPGDITLQQMLPFFLNAVPTGKRYERLVNALVHLLAECASIHNAATHLIENEQWDLMSVYYDSIDHFGHNFMELHPPRMKHVQDEDFEVFKDVMTGGYRLHDMLLGRLLQLAGDDATVIILSDHGFQNGEMRPPLQIDHGDNGKRSGAGTNPVAWHRPYGIFVAAGPGIKQDERIYGASLLDITPTILTLFGLPVADDMDGRALTQMLIDPPAVDTIPSYEPPHPADGIWRGDQAEQDPFAAQQAMQQLADLGYIDALSSDDATRVQRTVDDRKSNLAQVLFSKNDLPGALALLQELLESKNEAHMRCRVAMCLLLMKRFDEASAAMKTVEGEDKEIPLALVIRGELAFKRGAYDEAFSLFERAQAVDPRLPHLHVYLGRLHLRRRHTELAREAFVKALEIDPDNADAHEGIGTICVAEKQYEAALNSFMRAVSLQHARPITHLNMGDVLFKLRQYDWATRAYEVAAELAPHMALPHRRLARLARQTHANPLDVRLHLKRAIAARQKRDATI